MAVFLIGIEKGLMRDARRAVPEGQTHEKLGRIRKEGKKVGKFAGSLITLFPEKDQYFFCFVNFTEERRKKANKGIPG